MDNKKPLISIIIPVYNAEKYLNRCLDSVLNQSYKNLEIILVNDGSTDASLLICKNYSEKDKRIRVINKTNEGAAQARNTGLDCVRGEYIAFVDSDDFISSQIIEKLYSGATENDCDIAVCGYWTYYENQNINLNKKNKRIKNAILCENDTLKLFGWGNQVSANSIWAKLYKSELFEDIRFPEFKTAEDLFVAFRLYHKANKIYVTNEQMYYYICRQGSLMHGKKLNTNDTVLVCDKLIEYCCSNVEDEVQKEKMIALLLKIKADTILEDYYYSVKRRLDKSELEYMKEMYCKIQPQLKKKKILRPQYRVFELNPFLFCVCVEIYYTLIGRIKV